jgi:hypothetical protein
MSISNSNKQYIAIMLYMLYLLSLAVYIRSFFLFITGFWLFSNNLFLFFQFDKIPNFGGSLLFNFIVSFVYNVLIEVVFISLFGNDILGKILDIKYQETKNLKRKLYLKTILKYLILFFFIIRSAVSDLGFPDFILPWIILLLTILIGDVFLRIRSKNKSNLLNMITKINLQ